jgi:outer membrane protein OmpA-like peptidoglycan-associated protein
MEQHMSSRWIGCVAFAIAASLASRADAAGTLTAGNVTITTPMNVPKNGTTVATASGGAVTLASISFGAGCGGDITDATAGEPLAIPNGGTGTITIHFAPTVVVSESCTATMKDGGGATLGTFTVTANSTNAVIGVTNVAFGTVVDNTTASGTITVSNGATGTQTNLNVVSATITQTLNWFSFSATNGCTAGTTSCTFSPTINLTSPTTASVGVQCKPGATDTGTQTATVTFTSNTDPGGTSTANLSCTAGRPVISVPTTTLAFGNQLINTTSTAQTFTITNNGNEDLTYTLSSLGAGPFAYSSGCTSSCTVTAGLTNTINVTFTPTVESMNQTATITITNNDPAAQGGSAPTVALSGNGIAPDITTNVTTLSFGNVDVGSSSGSKTLTITNSGTSTLTLSAESFTSGAADYTAVDPSGFPITIAPGTNKSWSIFCSPSTFGSRPGNFRITSNANKTNGVTGSTLDVTLSCTGQQGVLSFAAGSLVSATSVAFGGVREGDPPVSQKISLCNIGNVAVTGISAMLDQMNVGYTFTNVPATLAANTCLLSSAANAVTITFTPVAGMDGGTAHLTFSGSWMGTAAHAIPVQPVCTITGTGLGVGYDTNPKPTLDFGTIRFDQPSTLPLQIIDTAASSVTIQSINITPAVGTMSGEFSVTGITHNSNPVTLPVTLTGVNDTLVASVKCTPANRVAMLSATLTIMSDLGTNPTRTVNLTCNSVSAQLVLVPATNVLDFGGVDLQATPHSVTQTITMTNTGSATLNITSNATFGGNTAPFVFSSTTAQAIAPNQTFSVTVTYTPTIEKPANAPDLATVTFPLSGLCGNGATCAAPSSATITVKGFGIDRHIAVGAAPTFPDTFRNPGTNAPILPVAITNNGDAPLSVTMVVVSGGPVWSLVDPSPVDIPGKDTYNFMVRFSPTQAGKAPDGELVLSDNDSKIPMVSVNLSGRGIDRSVEMAPVVIDLGFAAVGIPTRLSDVAPGSLLTVTSLDATHTFQVRAIQIDGGDGQFALDHPPSNVPLAPNAKLPFDVVLTPTAEGDVEATATLFLDQDPVAQSAVTLRAHAVVVAAGGGAGCTTGGGAGGGAIAIVLAIALVVRKRRAASIFCVLLAAPAARAQSTRDLAVTAYDPTPATTGNQLQLQSATVGAAGAWIATALVAYANDPIVITSTQNSDAAVRNRMTLQLGGAYALLGRVEIGARMPLYLQNGQTLDPMNDAGVAPVSGAARGDFTVHAKLAIARGHLGGGDAALGIAGALTLPTSSSGEFAGTTSPTGRVFALATIEPGDRLTFDVNLGALIRANAQYANIEQRSAFAFGAGGSYRVGDRTWLAFETFGDVTPYGRYAAVAGMGPGKTAATMLAIVGARHQLASAWQVTGEVGRGVIAGLGAPTVQAALALAYLPAGKLSRLSHRMRVESDRDGDGIPDSVDKCPNDPEDFDGFQDADGCPDPDNDQDGILDKDDKCPNEPEDRDGYQDADGCPDPDNDGDGIPDKKDRCPNAAEDFDGFQDADGCPDPDNDGDGIPDVSDRCPNEPETINGVQDDDGCPDKGDSLVVVSPDRLDLLDNVKFTHGNQVARGSFNLLGQIAATLRAHPEVLKLRIGSHVQPTGNADRDLSITEKRAQSVRDWLVQWGIAASRLDAHGFGGSKPLMSPTSNGAAQINDRVDFVIIERK